MNAVTLEQVAKRFGAVPALGALDLEVAGGEFLTVFGPSGSGKTTLLRLIAGLEVPDAGRISLAGRLVCGPGRWVAPQGRGVGMVFQNYALWPHMTARENVAFALVVARLPRAAVERRVAEVLELVELGDLAGKRPAELSGGEQQRVALARALAGRPVLLLMDECVSNLDARLRAKMAAELRRIKESTGVTTIYVTHDQGEAFTLSDRVAVLQDGRLEQVAPPGELYRRPRNALVAAALGPVNLLAPAVAAGLGLALPDLGPGEAGRVLGLRPEHLAVAPAVDGRNAASAGPVPARVARVDRLGEACDCWLQAGPITLCAHIPYRDGDPSACPAPGALVSISVAPQDWLVMESAAPARGHPGTQR